jgi:hypothetical protein
VGKLSRLEKAALACISVLFVVLCWISARSLNLWGDECYSLDLTSAPWKTLWLNKDVHTPSYFALLKAVVSLAGGDYAHEFLLRLLHLPVFLAGFYFGYLTVKRAWNSAALAALTILLTALFPLFAYYAVNLRMYGLLFFGSMWFIHAVSEFLAKDVRFQAKSWNVLLAGFCLLMADYSAVVLYGVGCVFITVRNFRQGNGKATGWLLIPPALLLVVLAPVIAPNLAHFATWSARSTLDNVGGHQMVKTVYDKFRPLVDLADISYRNIEIPLLQLVAYGVLLLTGVGVSAALIKRNRPSALPFLVAVAFAYLPTAAATQISPSRVYLCSQFFMAALIVQGWRWLEAQYHRAAVVGGALLLGLAAWMALHPVPRFNSLPPCHDIANDILMESHDLGISKVLISDNSLEGHPVRRYLLQEGLEPGAVGLLSTTFTAQDLPSAPFLYLSYMGDQGLGCLDLGRISSGRHGIVPLKEYVKLDNLPYNRIWKKNLQNNSTQDAAFILYAIR